MAHSVKRAIYTKTLYRFALCAMRFACAQRNSGEHRLFKDKARRIIYAMNGGMLSPFTRSW
jgi:hypothetical protein